MTPSPPFTLSKLDRHWLAESIRLTEGHAGPLDDAAANRRARTVGGDFGERILTRAEALAERDGLRDALARWRQSAGVLLFALALAALVIGGAQAVAALEGARPVNVFWALGSLLGLHLATLLAWLASLAAGAGGGALGRLWLWLSGRLAHDGRSVQLGPALLSLLGRNGLDRWGLGTLVHAFWLLVLAAALATLLALLAAQRYGFTWETTLLSADTFVGLTRGIGALPSWFGFPVPDAATVKASAAGTSTEAARRAWAGWLLGAVVIYGVLPRLLLAVFCAWRWRRNIHRLAVDPDLPEYAVLRERLLPASESLGVNDQALEHPMRQRLLDAIEADPGVHRQQEDDLEQRHQQRRAHRRAGGRRRRTGRARTGRTPSVATAAASGCGRCRDRERPASTPATARSAGACAAGAAGGRLRSAAFDRSRHDPVDRRTGRVGRGHAHLAGCAARRRGGRRCPAAGVACRHARTGPGDRGHGPCALAGNGPWLSR